MLERLYYDETNNHRRIRIRDDGLNVKPPLCFVLGGIVHAGPRRALPAAELRTALRLDRGIVDPPALQRGLAIAVPQ